MATVFYRVHHEGSQAEYSELDGFKAKSKIRGDLRSLLRDLTSRGQIVRHFKNHSNRVLVDTALISMCSSPEITLERALRERNEAVIYEIHPWKATVRFEYRGSRELARRISSLTGKAAVEYQYWAQLEQEFVAFNQIPREAIVRCWSVEEFRRSTYQTSGTGWTL